MLFNSYEYIFFFLPTTFFIYFFLLDKRLIIVAKGFLVFASLFFYSWWNITYLPLILSSMFFNFFIGNTLNENFKHIKIHRKSVLLFGVTLNLALLGYFKYMDFFISNLNPVFNSTMPLLHLGLPLAISFFTFQQIAYLVDSYRAETKEYDFTNYALFVTFFPQLIAGPIVHHKEMMPQFDSKWNLVRNYKNIALGLFVFSLGLFKKVVIADTFSIWATNGFDKVKVLTFFEAWATSLTYTYQLYFDFSGYTDMAIGAALLFNIKLPINFNSPYKATDIQAFWRRWHITLSRFLKDYIYIPLGGNRKGNFQTYNNLMLTFVIGGFWHGAGWTFVFWGFLHGIALIIVHIWKQLGFTLNKYLAWFITFNFVNIAWIFFRAKDWGNALKVLNGMMDFKTIFISPHFAQMLNYIFNLSYLKFKGTTYKYIFTIDTLEYLIVFSLVVFAMPNSMQISNIMPYSGKFIFKFNLKWAFIFAVFIYMSLMSAFFGNTTSSEFLYFNF